MQNLGKRKLKYTVSILKLFPRKLRSSIPDVRGVRLSRLLYQVAVQEMSAKLDNLSRDKRAALDHQLSVTPASQAS